MDLTNLDLNCKAFLPIKGNTQTNCMSFLDIKITRELNSFSTSVYRKPTFSGVFTNFDSFIPLSHNTGLILVIII